MAIKKLPTFKLYTVDFRLRQFRKVINKNEIEFVDFNSNNGSELMKCLFEEGNESAPKILQRKVAKSDTARTVDKSTIVE